MAAVNGYKAFDVKSAREKFPALAAEQVFFDNAGGSQVLGPVIDSYVLIPLHSSLELVQFRIEAIINIYLHSNLIRCTLPFSVLISLKHLELPSRIQCPTGRLL